VHSQVPNHVLGCNALRPAACGEPLWHGEERHASRSPMLFSLERSFDCRSSGIKRAQSIHDLVNLRFFLSTYCTSIVVVKSSPLFHTRTCTQQTRPHMLNPLSLFPRPSPQVQTLSLAFDLGLDWADPSVDVDSTSTSNNPKACPSAILFDYSRLARPHVIVYTQKLGGACVPFPAHRSCACGVAARTPCFVRSFKRVGRHRLRPETCRVMLSSGCYCY